METFRKLVLAVGLSETEDIEGTSCVQFPVDQEPIIEEKNTEDKYCEVWLFHYLVALYNVFVGKTRVIYILTTDYKVETFPKWKI